jgi:hypothetical protein
MKEHVLNSKEPLSSQQPKKVVFIEMFRAGPQISSTGQRMMFTENDLDQVVNTYDPARHEAPLIIGHDQDDGTPALGWVRKIWRKGNELWGKVELTPKAENLIRDGVFKKVSSSFYLPDAETNPTPGNLALRHLGLVSIPAVKGLTAFSEISEAETITFTPSEEESSISFKEHLGKNQTMARKKTKTETPTSVVEHSEGGMTVNINIGGGGASKANVYDDNGNKISETGAPADYEMDYGMDADPTMSMADDTKDGSDAPPTGDDSGSDMPTDPSAPDGTDGADGTDTPDGPGGPDDTTAPGGPDDTGTPSAPDVPSGADSGMPATEPTDDGGDEGPGMETDDVSGDMQDDDQKIAQLASEYEIDELIKALALKTDAASMMEDDGMSYGEMPEGLKKAIEAKREGSEDEEDDEEKETEDMGETVKEGEKPSEAEHPTSKEVKGADEPKGEQTYSEEETEVSDNGEGCKDYEEDEEEKKKESMTDKEATGTLDHSERAMGVQGQKNLQARVAELEEELARQKKLMREKEISDFCETLYENGKLTQQVVAKADLMRFMETLNNKNSVNFSETGKASQFDFFKNVLGNLPSMVSFEEFATPASAPKGRKQPTPSVDGYVYDPSTADLHAQALEYAEEKGVEYTFALKAILSDQ